VTQRFRRDHDFHQAFAKWLLENYTLLGWCDEPVDNTRVSGCTAWASLKMEPEAELIP
jgi:hypothetical protein